MGVFESREIVIEGETYDEIPRCVLVKIFRHLLAAEDVVNRSPHETRAVYIQVRRAKEGLSRMLDAAPIRSETPRRMVVDHLRSASALAEEHLSSGSNEGEIGLAIRKALSEARRGL